MLWEGETSFLKRANDFWDRFVKAAIGAGMLTIMLAIVFHVVGRYFLGKTHMGTMELIRYTMVWVCMLGAASAFNSGDHVSISMLQNYCSRMTWAVISILGNLLLAAFMVSMLIGGFEIALRNWHQTSMGLRVPMFFPYLAIPFGAFLTLPYFAINIFSAIMETRR